MLKNLKVGVRLAASFGLVTVLLAAISIMAIFRMVELNSVVTLMVEDRYPKILKVDEIINQVNISSRAIRNMIIIIDPEEIAKEGKRITESTAVITPLIAELEKTITTTEGKLLFQKITPIREEFRKRQSELIKLVESYKKDDAGTLLLGDFRKAQNDYIAALENLRKYQIELATRAAKESEQTTSLSITFIIALGAAAILIALLLALFITRSIVNPLAVCIKAAEHIARGELKIELDRTGTDEIAALQRTMGHMAETLQSLIDNMNRMSAEHDAGDIDVRIDAAQFNGAYKAMADGVNTMVFGHIAVKKKAMACVAEFGRGNFEAPLERFPGKKAFINETIEQVRVNLKALIVDADMLAQAAVEGRLATRADASRHQSDFRKIVDGVNRTLDLVIDPINETTDILKRMAEGDLTAEMTGTYAGDFNILKTALNDSIASINDILSQVVTAVGQVTAGGQQVAQASQALSQGATEQASSLEQITSSVTEISGQTRQNTENAVQVNTLAKTARNDADQGNTQMRDLVAAMSDINKSAEEIKKIVKAIDDISFQINLLALNANVEAARAGKYGKGFAVVAEEVRNLAVRSAGSVKETTHMVDVAIANIGRGNALVDVTAKQLTAIVDGAGKVAGLAEEVADASREQSTGLEQISTGLNQIDQVTQANTASAEESASAAEELSSQAQQLKAMLTRFKLREHESKMTESDILAMLRSEMAGKKKTNAFERAMTLHKKDARPASAKAGNAGRANPADIISLDDDDFGKF